MDRMRRSNVDPLVVARVEDGVKAMERYRPTWHEALAFFDNDQYVEQSAVTGQLDRVETRNGSDAKPRFRIRSTRNRYTSKLISECSLLIGRIPGYEVTPNNSDPRATNGANLGEKALLGLHDSLQLDRVAIDTLIHAANCGSGYTWPYWNGKEGPFVGTTDEGEHVQMGSVGVWKLRQDEVIWEDGVEFAESQWYCVRKAQPVEAVKARAGYIGPQDLKPDAESTLMEARQGQGDKNLVFVHHYLEKPTPQLPRGRWVVFANNQVIERGGDWPCIDEMTGEAIPVLHQMSWIRRAHRHRDMGPGEMLVELQRDYNRTVSQIAEWQQLVLQPQVFAPLGSLLDEYTNEAGAVFEYRPIGGLKPEWRQTPDIPIGLFQQLDRIVADMEEIVAGGPGFPADTESASHVQELNAREEGRRALVVKELARWWATMGRHILYLVQKHYEEPRLMRLQGRFGPDRTLSFKGSDIPNSLDVRVAEASITPQTRAAQEAKIMMFADKGWVEPHKAMAALSGGSAQRLIDEFELDINRQYREIEQMMELANAPAPELREDLPPEYQMALLQEHLSATSPYVEEHDNHTIHMDVLKQWMKTRDFDEQPDVVKGIARLHYMQHQQADQAMLMQEMQRQSMMAAQAGMNNAGSPAAAGGAQKVEPSRASAASHKEGFQ